MMKDVEMQCPYCFKARIQISGSIWDNGGICKCKNCNSRLRIRPHKVATSVDGELQRRETKKRIKK